MRKNRTFARMKLILIDAYAIIYRSYYALIRSPRINTKGLNTSAIMGFCNTLNEVLQKENPTHIAVAFDPKGGTFRHEIFPQYKAQREETPEDIRKAVPIIKDILSAMNIQILEIPGFEADDVIGTYATYAGNKGILTYMLTPDKDYGQLVSENVFMYKPRHGGGYDIMGPQEICDKYGIQRADQVIDLLGLMGDTADNIPGCSGVGEKTAVKLIKEFGSIENLLVSTDKLKGALQRKIIENREQIKLSKHLVVIKKDIPTEINLESLVRKPINEEKLTEIFQELEFRTLLNKFLGKPVEKKQKNNADDVPSLFSQSQGKSAKKEADSPNFFDLFANNNADGDLFGALNEEKSTLFDQINLDNEEVRAKILEKSFVEKIFNLDILLPFLSSKDVISAFRHVLEDETIEKVSMNIKQAITQLKNLGIELKGEFFDTTIAQYLIQSEIRPRTDFNVNDLLDIRESLLQKLKECEAESLFREIEMPLVSVLAEMESTGVCLDTKILAETSVSFNNRLKAIEAEIFQQAGQTFNIQSPRQVGEILFGKLQLLEKPKKTRTGQFVTNEETLQSLKSKHPIVENILAYRGLKKLMGTYVEALPKLINPKTQRIHTSFNQTVTATGRLSSSDPNLQNIPIRREDGKEIRKAFVPEPGHLFFSADYSQIELRVMAHLSGDENMIEAFNSGHDIHAATAAKIYHKNIEEVTKDERTKAKRANFGIIYGISVWGLAESLNIDRVEAKALIEGYFNSFPKVKKFIEHQIDKVRQTGYAETMFHRRRYLPDITSHNSTVRSFAERNAVNAPIQGTAADIIKLAMVRVYRRMKQENLQSKLILQVHDELNFSVLPAERETLESLVISEMQNACQLSVPLIADSGWGTNWLEAH